MRYSHPDLSQGALNFDAFNNSYKPDIDRNLPLNAEADIIDLLGDAALLDYSTGTDLHTATAVAAATWTDVVTTPSFTIPAALGRCVVAVSGNIRCGGMATAGYITSRFQLSGQNYLLGGAPDVAIGAYVNPLQGVNWVPVPVLAAGSYTLTLQVRFDYAGTMDLRPFTLADKEFLRIAVLRRY